MTRVDEFAFRVSCALRHVDAELLAGALGSDSCSPVCLVERADFMSHPLTAQLLKDAAKLVPTLTSALHKASRCPLAMR